MDDFDIALARAREGDAAAFAGIWRAFQPRLLRYLAVCAAPGQAEDVASETWLRVVRGLAGFTGDEAAFAAWLFTIARHRAVDDARRANRRAETAVPAVPEQGDGAAPDAAEAALETISTERAMALIATLPPEQAEIVTLRVVAGLDVDAVADLVGKSPGAVRVAAHRGLRRLAAALAPRPDGPLGTAPAGVARPAPGAGAVTR